MKRTKIRFKVDILSHEIVIKMRIITKQVYFMFPLKKLTQLSIYFSTMLCAPCLFKLFSHFQCFVSPYRKLPYFLKLGLRLKKKSWPLTKETSTRKERILRILRGNIASFSYWLSDRVPEVFDLFGALWPKRLCAGTGYHPRSKRVVHHHHPFIHGRYEPAKPRS